MTSLFDLLIISVVIYIYRLANNPVCGEVGNKPSFCSAIKHSSSFATLQTITDLFKNFIYNVDSVAVRNIREYAT